METISGILLEYNDEPFFPGLNSVFDDQIVDGKTYSMQVDKGVNRNEEFDLKIMAFYDKGDTVTLKLTNIDKATMISGERWNIVIPVSEILFHLLRKCLVILAEAPWVILGDMLPTSERLSFQSDCSHAIQNPFQMTGWIVHLPLFLPNF